LAQLFLATSGAYYFSQLVLLKDGNIYNDKH